MKDLTNFVRQTSALVAMASIIAFGTGFINAILVAKMMALQPENWTAFVTQMCLSVLFIGGGAAMFIARKTQNFWLEFLTLPLLIVGAAITLILYVQTVSESVISFNPGITVLIIVILELRRRDLKKIHETLKLSDRIIDKELPSTRGL